MESKADEVFKKVMKLPTRDLLLLCANAIESGMDKKRLDALFLCLESRLQKVRLMSQFDFGKDE